ncbi:lipopolysaccharide heptosyltransferase family protein [Alphaproteobacteria bacterium HT1-32]|nr:lipopolysaccharide heptosyltransferase family protein [Alphaproteobacteria bacterium HT1-32]
MSSYLAAMADRFADATRPSRTGEASGVLLVSAGGLGDTILFSHLAERFAALAEPGEKITILLRRDGARTAFLLPEDWEVITIDFPRFRKNMSYRSEQSMMLYRRHFRLVVSTDFLRHPEIDERMMLACAAPRTVAMKAKPWEKYASALAGHEQRFSQVWDSGPVLQDKMLRWAAFADWLTGEVSPPPALPLPSVRLPEAAHFDRPTVLIQAFSAVKEKQWPATRYAALLDRLPVGTEVRFLGAPGELEANPDYADLIARPNVSFDTSTFEQLVPMLRGAALVISADTAVMHLAAAVGGRTLCIASAAYVGEIVPYAPELLPDNLTVQYQSMPCEGCLGDCRFEAIDGMYPCLAQLPVSAVHDAVDRLLESSQ